MTVRESAIKAARWVQENRFACAEETLLMAEEILRIAQMTPKRTFSDFIRNASDAEKTEVYTEVMEKASERQRNAIPMDNGSTLEFRDYGDGEQLKSVRDELDKSK